METPRATRTPTCTVPRLLVGLTKLCKLSKVCAAPALDNDDATFRNCGGYDQRLVLIRLFETVASLKSAYIKLQKAHIPYDPAKIAFADEIIAYELDSVTALQCLCSSSRGVGPLVNERWSLLQELEAETRKRDSDILLLKRELEGLRRENSRLNKQIKSKKPSVKHDDKGFVVPTKESITTTPSALLEQFKVASTSVHDFAGLITSLLTCSDNRIGNADAAEQSWNRYSLEAYLSRTMLGTGTEEQEEGFEIDAAHEVLRSSGRLDATPKLQFLKVLPDKALGRRAVRDGGGDVQEPGAEDVRVARRAPQDVVLPGVRDDGKVGVGAASGHGEVPLRWSECHHVLREEREQVRGGVHGERGCCTCIWQAQRCVHRDAGSQGRQHGGRQHGGGVQGIPV
uniref:DUF641 domain-containing protein n=1 Tax=Arundo donax TaxID=35708 RepID=A0A0A9HR62_ARUDO